MNVRDSNIIGMIVGFVFGGLFPLQFEIVSLFVAGLTALNWLFSKKQIMKGPLWGLIIGILLGYSLRGYLPYLFPKV
jgi:hypothetical protein